MATEEDFVSLAPSRLCATCQGISLVKYNTESIGPRLPHHETLVSFEAAIKEGCYICTRVGEEFSSSRGEEDAYRDAEIVEQNIFSMYSAVLLDRPDPFAAVHITQRGMHTSFVLYPSESKFICGDLSIFPNEKAANRTIKITLLETPCQQALLHGRPALFFNHGSRHAQNSTLTAIILALGIGHRPGCLILVLPPPHGSSVFLQ